MLSVGAQESQDNISGLLVGLNKGVKAWKNTNQQVAALPELRLQEVIVELWMSHCQICLSTDPTS